MATVKNKMNGAYKSPSTCKSRKKSGISQRIISLFLAFITTFLAVGIMPWTAQDIYAEPQKTGYHKGSLTKTYNIVKLDDQSYFSDCGGTYGGYRDSTKSKFSWPYEEYCGEIEADAEGHAGHWYKQAASYYGFYDEIYKAWVMTGVQVYGGKSNRVQIDDPASCNHTHDSTAFNYNTRSWEAAEIPKEKKIGDLYGNGEDGISLVSKEGCTVTFTETIHISGTVSVTYPDTWVPDEYTITFYPENSEGSFSKMVTYDAENNNDVSSSVPSKAGYSFGGWYSQKDGRGTKAYDASGKAVKGTYWSADDGTAVWRGTSDTSLYAYWIQDSFTVTLYFYKNGTKDDTKTKTYSVDKNTTFNAYDHRADSSFGDQYEYSGISGTSWIVTADGSANVYYTGKKYTQTLYFYKDGTKDNSKTVTCDAAYGTEFDAYSHRVDSSFGEGYEYSGISASTWTVSGAGSANVYYTKKKFTQTLNFYRNGVFQKSKTYAADYGSTFSAASHADDVTFDHCHYDHADKASWTVSKADSTNVYHVWDTYTLAYHGNKNTGGSTPSQTVNYNTKATVAKNGFTRTGYSFAGWNTRADGKGTSHAVGSTPVMTSDINLYAQWKINKYTITLKKGTGISSVSGAGTYDYGTNVTIAAAVKTGYTWSGWTGTFAESAKQHKFSIHAQNITLTANATPNKYTVAFDGNGGTISSNAKKGLTVTFDAAAGNSIPNITAARPGYEFTGWKAGSSDDSESIWDASGNAVKGSYWSAGGSSAVWKHAGNVTAYAGWKDITPPTVAVSPSATDSYTTSLDVTITVSDNDELSQANSYRYCITMNDSEPDRNAASSDGEWTDYASGSAFTIGSGLTGTYYLWVKRIEDKSGNKSETDANMLTADSCHRFGPYYFDNTAPDLSRVDSSYGWFSEGTTVAFDISDPHSGIVSAQLTNFNGIAVDGGDITYSRQFYFRTESVSLYCLTVSDRLGNTSKKPFLVKLDKNGDVIPDNAVWKGLSDVRLFAHWIPNAYTVHFEKNDNYSGSTRASGEMQDVIMHYDVREKLPANNFVREGYAFAGWNKSPDGTADNGTCYEDEAWVVNLTLIPGGTATLYAQWKASEYTLAFDYSKPENASHEITGADEKSRTVSFDKSIGSLPQPKLEGWIFEGWYIDDMPVSGSDIWHYTSDMTATAKWMPVAYEVRLHSAVPEYALGTLVKTDPSGFAWTEEEYYSAMFTYDSESFIPAPQDTYSLDEYEISGWYANELLTVYAGSGGNKKWNLTAVNGGIVHLYPSWKDTSEPEINVTPTHTENPDADNNSVKSIDITITVTEHGSGLSADNIYEYGFSLSPDTLPSEWNSYCDAPIPEGFTVTLPELGASLDGYYYFFVRQIKDASGNSSVSPTAIDTAKSCHIYGVYVFDNTAPAGTVKYVENNEMLGLYDEKITDAPYAVMTIYNPYDEISGVESFTLHISDASDSSNSADFSFTPDGGTYTCRFTLYDCLDDSENVEKVTMQVIAKDKLGNTATLPVTQYDFGTKQTGATVKAEEIDYRDIHAEDEFIYERDNFRVEAYIQAVTGGTKFKAGQWGTLRIYTFGYVEAVEADFGSLMNYFNAAYDKDPTLIRTDIDRKLSMMYEHEFAIPLYCTDSSFNDTKAIGHKKGSSQYRYVDYDVTGSILDDIRTILKYKVY